MTLSQLIFSAVVFLVILTFILFPDFRAKFKVLCGGFLNVFLEDAAKTPEGAKAIYQQAIEEAQVKYNNSTDALRTVSGKYSNENKKLSNLKSELSKTEKACESFVKSGQMEEAKLYAEKREDLVEEIKRKEIIVLELEKVVAEASNVSNHNEKVLKKLKQQSKTIVSEMEMKKQLAEMYDELDEMKKTKASDKLLQSVQDGYEDLTMKATGAKIVNENKISTKLQRADEKASKLNADAYLKELQNKYNK